MKEQISNQELVAELKELVKKEREVIATIVKYLHLVWKRKLYAELGYSSMFVFCTEALGYSGGAAYRRIQAAKCIEDMPEIIEKLESGIISLCAISEIARVEPEKRAPLFSLSEGKSKIEVARLVAESLPPIATSKKERVRPIRVKSPEAPLFTSTVEVKSETKYSVTLELSKEEYDLLTEAQEISGSTTRSQAIVRALKLYRKVRSPKERVERRKKRKAKVTSTVKVTRHIPDPLRDEVTIRDNCQCTFVSKDNQRCRETRFLQIDHIKPFSMGGEHSKENLRLLCPAHNRLVYERVR